MADCKIQLGDRNFWIHEDFFQLALYYIYQEVKKPEYTQINNKSLFLEDLEFKVNGYASTYLTLGWDDFIDSPSKKLAMAAALEKVKINLKSIGEYISLEELKTLNTEDTHIKHWVKPFPVQFLVKIINALIQVILGTWAYNNQDIGNDFL